jgi:hypothetical protein
MVPRIIPGAVALLIPVTGAPDCVAFAMRDALQMRLLERVGDLDPDLERLLERQRSALDSRGERLAFEILHDEEVGVALAADVVQRADVRMIERGNRLRFTVEALLHLRVVGEVRRKHLDGDRAVQPRIGRLVHLAHAAGTERPDDLVWSELDTGLERHGSGAIIASEAQPVNAQIQTDRCAAPRAR